MGSYHMWFLYMIASMYLLTPILQKVTESDQLTRYFMVLSILFGSLGGICILGRGSFFTGKREKNRI